MTHIYSGPELRILQTTKGCDTYHRHLVGVEDQWGRILHCPRGSRRVRNCVVPVPRRDLQLVLCKSDLLTEAQ